MAGWGVSALVGMISNMIGVPIGSKLRSSGVDPKNDAGRLGVSKNPQSDLIKSIVSITQDDICIGANPFYYKTMDSPDVAEKVKLDKILKQLNSVSKWIAKDLLMKGVSVYIFKVVKNNIYLYPVIGEVEIVLNKNKKLELLS